jgi:hypothetical protein
MYMDFFFSWARQHKWPGTHRSLRLIVQIYGLTFGSAESRLFLFAAQCFNIESMQKVFLCHGCV